jgi:hypothetical protein
MSLVALCALLVFVAARGEELLCLSDRIRDALGLTAALVLVQCLVLGAERPCRHEQHGAIAVVAGEGGAP